MISDRKLSKLSVGLASALLGTIVYGINQHVSADTVENGSQELSVASSTQPYQSVTGSKNAVEQLSGSFTNSDMNRDGTAGNLSVNYSQTGDILTSRDLAKGNVTMSFDVDGSKVTPGQEINLGSLRPVFNSNGQSIRFQVNGLIQYPVTVNGVNYGSLNLASEAPSGVSFSYAPSVAVTQLQGLKRLTINMPQCVDINWQSPVTAYDRVHKECDTDLQFIDYNQVKHALKHYSVAALVNYPPLKNWGGTGNALHFNAGFGRADVAGFMGVSTDKQERFVNSQDRSLITLPDVYEQAELVSGDSIPGGAFMILDVPVWNDLGIVTDENFQLDANMLGINSWMGFSRLADGLSLSAIKDTVSGSGCWYSVQSDGTTIVYQRINTHDFMSNLNFDYIRSFLKQQSFVIGLASNDPEKALNNTINGIKAGLIWDMLSLNVVSSDTNHGSSLEVTKLDPSTGNPIGPTSRTTLLANSVAEQGQTSIKLHVINSVNGTDVVSVKTFSDWPNKGYKANLEMPGHIDDYQFVTDENTAKDYLAKLGKHGYVLTKNVVVDYPDEQTGVVDYYVLANPKYTTKVEYKDVDGGSIYRDDFEYYYPEVSAVQTNEHSSSKYVIAKGQQDNYQLDYNHRDFTIMMPARMQFIEGKHSDNADLHKTVKRVIKIDGNVVDQQSVNFVRNKFINLSDRTPYYTDWVADGNNSFTEFIPEHKAGYTIDSVDSYVVKPMDVGDIIDLQYKPISTYQENKFVDTTGKLYASMPIGYHSVGSESNDGLVLINRDVKPNNKQTKYIIRTVRIELPNGRSRLIHQKVMVGHVFGNVRLPKLRGYKAVVTGGNVVGHLAKNNENVVVKFVKL